MCVYVYVCMCMYVCVCMYVYVCVCVYECMYVCVCMYVCMFMYVYVCMCVCVCAGCVSFLDHLYEFRKRHIAHQRKNLFENKLVLIILRILLSQMFN